MPATATIQSAFCRHVAVQNQGLNIGAVYNVMTSSPCKKRPDTGKACDRIYEDKNSKECLECQLLGNIKQNFSFSETKTSKIPCLFKGCKNLTTHQSYLCYSCRERVRRRDKRWRELHDTEPPNDYLYKEIIRKKEWGICSMQDCKKTANRTIKHYGEFCKSHSQTAWTRIHKANGNISIQEVCKKPDKSKIRIRKKVQDEHYNNKSN